MKRVPRARAREGQPGQVTPTVPTTAVDEAVAVALNHHKAGRLEEASRIYEGILRVKPGHADVLHLFGVLNAQLGKFDVAVALLTKATRKQPMGLTILACGHMQAEPGNLHAQLQKSTFATRKQYQYTSAYDQIAPLLGLHLIMESPEIDILPKIQPGEKGRSKRTMENTKPIYWVQIVPQKDSTILTNDCSDSTRPRHTES